VLFNSYVVVVAFKQLGSLYR